MRYQAALMTGVVVAVSSEPDFPDTFSVSKLRVRTIWRFWVHPLRISLRFHHNSKDADRVAGSEIPQGATISGECLGLELPFA